MNELSKDVRKLASQLASLKRKAEALGIFPGDRELLECPSCGLLEDVTIGGRLITYVAAAEGQDSGHRFHETSPGNFRCPACGSNICEG